MSVLEELFEKISQPISCTEDDGIANTRHYAFLLENSGYENLSLAKEFVCKKMAYELYQYDKHGFLDPDSLQEDITFYFQEASGKGFDEVFQYYFNYKTNAQWDEDTEEFDAVLKLNPEEQLGDVLVATICAKAIVNEICIEWLTLQCLLSKKVTREAWYNLFGVEENEYEQEVVDGIITSLIA